MKKEIKVKYFTDLVTIQQNDNGNWVDLKASETVELKKDEFKLIPLGVGMILPDGYEAHIVPRSSTYKSFGVISTNHCGIIDNSYSGNNDEWKFPAYALRDTIINKGDRICQFRIVKKQPTLDMIIVDRLNDKDRGGFGSSGR